MRTRPDLPIALFFQVQVETGNQIWVPYGHTWLSVSLLRVWRFGLRFSTLRDMHTLFCRCSSCSLWQHSGVQLCFHKSSLHSRCSHPLASLMWLFSPGRRCSAGACTLWPLFLLLPAHAPIGSQLSYNMFLLAMVPMGGGFSSHLVHILLVIRGHSVPLPAILPIGSSLRSSLSLQLVGVMRCIGPSPRHSHIFLCLLSTATWQ